MQILELENDILDEKKLKKYSKDIKETLDYLRAMNDSVKISGVAIELKRLDNILKETVDRINKLRTDPKYFAC